MSDTDKINASLDEIDFVFSDTIHAELGASVIAALRIALEGLETRAKIIESMSQGNHDRYAERRIAEALEGKP